MLIHPLLSRSADRAPDRIALSTADCPVLTYSAAATLTDRLARGLRSHAGPALGRGDRVALCLDNRVETALLFFAALRAGAAALLINPATRDEKLLRLLSHAGARVLCAPARRLAALSAGLPPALRLLVAVGDEPSAPPVLPYRALLDAAPGDLPDPIDTDLAALLYTSGSSGEPKGVMLTHRNLRSAIASIVSYLQLGQSDVIYSVLPLSFGYGLTQLLTAAAVGASLVLDQGMAFPHLCATRMSQARATGFAVVPTIASLLLSLDLSRYDLSSLRYLTNAGAGMPVEHVRKLRAALPGARLYLMYGQTECVRASYLDPCQVDERPGSVGKGVPNQDLAVVDEEGRPVAPGQVGELLVRGSHVMAGYLGAEAETAARLRPAPLAFPHAPPGEPVLHTGDLFRRDEEGYLYFVSRRDDIIKCRGEKVSPREVEEVLHRLPEVREAAVVGVPHPLHGQAVKAVLVLQPGAELTARQVQKRCAALLEDVMVPAVIEFRDSLPKSDNGKVRKGLL